MEIKGKVHEVGVTIQVTDSFKKRDLIVEYVENPQYPEFLKFEAIQDRVSILDMCEVGDDVVVNFNIKGRGSPDKANPGRKVYFNQLQVWKITIPGKYKADPGAYVPPAETSGAPDEDDLPF